MDTRAASLPPTSPELLGDGGTPYFVWWLPMSNGTLRRLVHSPDRNERCYWTAVVMREANTRDVWAFVHPSEIRELWSPSLIRHLGRSRAMWAYLLGMPDLPWPPPEARSA